MITDTVQCTLYIVCALHQKICATYDESVLIHLLHISVLIYVVLDQGRQMFMIGVWTTMIPPIKL